MSTKFETIFNKVLKFLSLSIDFLNIVLYNNNMKTLAYFGFAANPPHLGHYKAIEWLSKQVDLVVVSPSAGHAFGKKMQPYDTRLNWTKILLKQASSNVMVSDIENKIALFKTNSAVVYSYDVLTALSKMDDTKDYKILLAIGPDNAEPAVWSKFYEYEKIEVEYGKIVIPEMKNVVRSTYIRNLYTNASPTLNELIPLVGVDLANDLINNFGDVKW